MAEGRVVTFRAPPQLADALAVAAGKEGVTVSEFIRQAAEDRLAKAPAPAPTAPGALDPFAKLSQAARGNLQAQRDIANEAIRQAFDPALARDPVATLREGLIFARLAAAHGQVRDQGLVISMIALVAELAGEEETQSEMGEALARIAWVAENSADDPAAAEIAGNGLVWAAGECSAQVVALSKHYLERLKDGVEG